MRRWPNLSQPVRRRHPLRTILSPREKRSSLTRRSTETVGLAGRVILPRTTSPLIPLSLPPYRPLIRCLSLSLTPTLKRISRIRS